MKKLLGFVLVFSILWSLAGCASPASPQRDHVDLIQYGDDDVNLLITKRQWKGFWGREGYKGYQDTHYAALLRGSGPVFTNPEFQDNPYFDCLGTITLDREHNRVTINLRRIISKEGEPERTKSHPANGIYPIASARKSPPPKPFPAE